MDRDDRASSRASSSTAPGKSLKPPNHVEKPALAGAAAIWRSPRRRLTLPARLPSDISTLQKSRHLYLVATSPQGDWLFGALPKNYIRRTVIFAVPAFFLK